MYVCRYVCMCVCTRVYACTYVCCRCGCCRCCCPRARHVKTQPSKPVPQPAFCYQTLCRQRPAILTILSFGLYSATTPCPARGQLFSLIVLLRNKHAGFAARGHRYLQDYHLALLQLSLILLLRNCHVVLLQLDCLPQKQACWRSLHMT